MKSTLILALAAAANAHTVGWAKGMYCLGGSDPSVDIPNQNDAVNPLYQFKQEDWWFQHERGCDKAPPKDGDILELPAGGQVTLEMAHNRAFTSLSYDGEMTTAWPDGKEHPEDWRGAGNPPECIQDDGALHTNNQSMAAGTALAISYESELSAVTMENLVVFSVLEHTPWKRIAKYDVPKDLPACPEGGCHCAWLWIPNGCGEGNMYMAGYRCNVTGATSTTPLDLPAKAPVYCADDASKCVKGAKQMMAWEQETGNNIEPPQGVSPSYDALMGYNPGAQDDIFASSSPAKEEENVKSKASSCPAGPTVTVTVTATAPAVTVTKSA